MANLRSMPWYLARQALPGAEPSLPAGASRFLQLNEGSVNVGVTRRPRGLATDTHLLPDLVVGPTLEERGNRRLVEELGHLPELVGQPGHF